MVATCGGVFFGVAVWVALTGGRRLARDVRALPLRVRRVDRRGHLAAGDGRGLRLSDAGRRLRRRRGTGDPVPAPREPPPAPRWHRAPLPAPATRECVGSSSWWWRARHCGAPRARSPRAGAGRASRPSIARTRRPAPRSTRSGSCPQTAPTRSLRARRSWRTTLRRSRPGGWARTRRGRRASTTRSSRPAPAPTSRSSGWPSRRRRSSARTTRSSSVETRPRHDGASPNIFKKYLVYYDGPSVQTDVCGTGGGNFLSGPSFAVDLARRLRGCPDRRDHGARAPARPRALCPQERRMRAPQRTTRSAPSTIRAIRATRRQDVLYPVTSGAPLAQLVLDVNHDDYYAHSGAWDDIQDSALAPSRCSSGRPARADDRRRGRRWRASCRASLCSVVLHDPVGRRHADRARPKSRPTGRAVRRLERRAAPEGAPAPHTRQPSLRVGDFGPARVPVALGEDRERNHHVRAALRQDVRRRRAPHAARRAGEGLEVRLVDRRLRERAVATCRPKTDYPRPRSGDLQLRWR